MNTKIGICKGNKMDKEEYQHAVFELTDLMEEVEKDQEELETIAEQIYDHIDYLAEVNPTLQQLQETFYHQSFLMQAQLEVLEAVRDKMGSSNPEERKQLDETFEQRNKEYDEIIQTSLNILKQDATVIRNTYVVNITKENQEEYTKHILQLENIIIRLSSYINNLNK